MSMNALREYVRFTKYARYNDAEGRRETWPEQVSRVMGMHRKKYSEIIKDNPELLSIIDGVQAAMKSYKVLGSQRALQYGGRPIEQKNSRIYNCTASYADRPRFFQEAFWLLLCGCGVGFSVQIKHIKKLPNIKRPAVDVITHSVEDSIEGWSDAIGALVDSYFDGTSTVEFDYSNIRPEGVAISSGGKAPGSKLLERAINNVRKLLNSRLDEGITKLRSIDVYDITMHIADAVVSGGVRKSATICLFSYDDDLMMNAKTGNWFNDNPQRGRSNNSALLIRGKTTREQYDRLCKSTKEFGEPGFIWSDDEDVLYNPCCVAGDTLIKTSGGDKKAQDLVGIKFTAVLDGEEHESTANGFWFTGVKPVAEYTFKSGRKLKITLDHQVMTREGWREIGELRIGDDVRLSKTLPSDVYTYDQIVDCIDAGNEAVYDCSIPELGAFSANGLYVHNCEIALYAYDRHGKSGWAFCNLSEINASKVKTEADFYLACEAAAAIGTLQAGYTSFPYLGKVTEDIVKREALIGVSMTGMMDSPEITLDPAIQRAGAEIVKDTNKKVAKFIGINQAARTTCVKPAGSSSAMLGTASGIHPHHARRYIRRVQASRIEVPLQFYKMHNPRSVEKSVWDPNGVTDVISFLCEVPKGARTKNDVGAMELLANVKLTQDNWVRAGTNEELCAKPYLRHNVSNTINVKDDEWQNVFDFIYDNRDSFAGVSLLSMTGDKDYPQAPFVRVMYPGEITAEYGAGSLMASGLIVSAMDNWDNNLWAACECLIHQAEEDKVLGDAGKVGWLTRARTFARKYFAGNVKKMVYCLKDVQNLYTWETLSREYIDVDWSLCHEDSDVTAPASELACAGGQCEIQ